MPTNLPPEYYQVEEQYRAATDPGERVRLLEELISTIPKHKGTDKLRADLRRRLSKLKDAAGSRKTGSRQVSPYQIDREGAGQVAVIGPPNTGKSSLIEALTNAEPEVAPYPFTTRFPLAGMMEFENVQIQLIDTPPLHVDFDEPAFYALVRRADLMLLVVDMQGSTIQQFEDSLAILKDHRIWPLHMQPHAPDDPRLIFRPLQVLVNKTDDEGHDEDFKVLCELLGVGDECPLLPVSVATPRNLDTLRRTIFDRLDLVRVYSRPPGKEANFNAPFVMKRGGTLEEFAGKVHRDFVQNLKSARVWGTSVDFEGQMVGRDHVLVDGDVVELRA